VVFMLRDDFVLGSCVSMRSMKRLCDSYFAEILDLYNYLLFTCALLYDALIVPVIR
jgi:hypothetical protein